MFVAPARNKILPIVPLFSGSEHTIEPPLIFTELSSAPVYAPNENVEEPPVMVIIPEFSTEVARRTLPTAVRLPFLPIFRIDFFPSPATKFSVTFIVPFIEISLNSSSELPSNP